MYERWRTERRERGEKERGGEARRGEGPARPALFRMSQGPPGIPQPREREMKWMRGGCGCNLGSIDRDLCNFPRWTQNCHQSKTKKCGGKGFTPRKKTTQRFRAVIVDWSTYEGRRNPRFNYVVPQRHTELSIFLEHLQTNQTLQKSWRKYI